MSASISPRTLIVEDEPDLLETCVRILQQVGHSCLTAPSAREAITLIDTRQPDLVVTDLRLPTVDGLAVARHARRASPPVPVIVTTGYTSPEARRDAYKAGASIFLPKPFTAAEFVDAVKRALGIPPA